MRLLQYEASWHPIRLCQVDQCPDPGLAASVCVIHTKSQLRRLSLFFSVAKVCWLDPEWWKAPEWLEGPDSIFRKIGVEY